MCDFKSAIKLMKEHDEFPKIIKFAEGEDYENAKEYWEAISNVNVDDIPQILLLQECKSASVLKDAIVYMMG